MAYFVAFVVAAGFTALNVVMYVMTGSMWSLGAAIFCGAFIPFNLVKIAKG